MNGVTRLITSLSVLNQVMRKLAATESTAPSVQAVLCTDETPPPKLANEFLTTCPALVELRNVYSMTEMCGPIAAPQPDVISPHNSVGFPMPSIRIKVINTETGTVLGPMELGEVLVHSDTFIMLGYTQEPEETPAAFTDDGWFRTGDCGFYNEDGCLFLRDRIETLISCAGCLVSPCELEELLVSHPDVSDAAVFGVPRYRYGNETSQEWRTEEQALTALVVAVKGRCPDPCFALELKRYVAERVKPSAQLSGGIFFVNEVPKTITKKVARGQLLTKLDSLLLCGKFT
ncbi:uncharacterized protein LOC144119861 [Amblyomma americanum]